MKIQGRFKLLYIGLIVLGCGFLLVFGYHTLSQSSVFFTKQTLVSYDVDNTIQTLFTHQADILNVLPDREVPTNEVYRNSLISLWQLHPDLFVHDKSVKNGTYQVTRVTFSKNVIDWLKSGIVNQSLSMANEVGYSAYLPCFMDPAYGFPCVTIVELENQTQKIDNFQPWIRRDYFLSGVQDIFWLDKEHVVFGTGENAIGYMICDVNMPNQCNHDRYRFGSEDRNLHRSYYFIQDRPGEESYGFEMRMSKPRLTNLSDVNTFDLDIYSFYPSLHKDPDLFPNAQFLTSIKGIKTELGYRGLTYHEPLEVLLGPTLRSALTDPKQENSVKFYFTIQGHTYEYNLEKNLLTKLQSIPDNDGFSGKLVFDRF